MVWIPISAFVIFCGAMLYVVYEAARHQPK